MSADPGRPALAIAIWWIRRDRRLTDNVALRAALAHAGPKGSVLPLFILDGGWQWTAGVGADVAQVHLACRIGADYPAPFVAHASARARVLAAFAAVRAAM